ncbi:hypothetical protein THAOC_28181, partial [Thalassiosira oceanica]
MYAKPWVRGARLPPANGGCGYSPGRRVRRVVLGRGFPDTPCGISSGPWRASAGAMWESRDGPAARTRLPARGTYEQEGRGLRAGAKTSAGRFPGTSVSFPRTTEGQSKQDPLGALLPWRFCISLQVGDSVCFAGGLGLRLPPPAADEWVSTELWRISRPPRRKILTGCQRRSPPAPARTPHRMGARWSPLAATSADLQALCQEIDKKNDRALACVRPGGRLRNPAVKSSSPSTTASRSPTSAHFPGSQIVVELLSATSWETFDTPNESTVTASTVAKDLNMNFAGLGASKGTLLAIASE